jgi:molecular chaperone GrpE
MVDKKKTSSTKTEEVKGQVDKDQPIEEAKESEEEVKAPKKEKKSAKTVKKKTQKDKLAVAEEKYNTLNDKYLRLYSEFDNYRKRTSREKLEMSKVATEGLMADLLPVLDDFERALKSSEEAVDLEAIREGEKLIYNKFRKLLELKGLEPIESVGKDFDTDLHEAITKFPAPSEEMKGKVIDETEKGYKLNGKVIRFSKVVIGE